MTKTPQHYAQYKSQKCQAKVRGISFDLTFDQWLQIWQDSGHLHERGCHNGQYCMARNGDRGPYAAGNVSIVTVRQNQSDKKQSKQSRLLISISRRGEDNSAAYLTKKVVQHLRKKFALDSRRGSIARLAKSFQIPYGTVYGILKGRGWRYLP